MHMLRTLLPTALVLAFTHASWAQTLPDAGIHIQRIPTAPLASDTPESIRVDPQPDPQAPTAEAIATVFQVRHLQLTGVTLFHEDDLLHAAGFEPGLTINLAALQAMAQRITHYYRQHGYLVAKAYLPAQDITHGVVTMTVLEGQYGLIQLDNTSRLHTSVIDGLMAGLEPNAVIALAPLETRLLLLSDVPGIRVRSTLVPGEQVGLSNVVVNVMPGPRVSGSIDADNLGNRYTGETRLGATVRLNNPSGRGDLASVRMMSSGSGMHYARVSYQAPMGRGHVGAAYSDLRYALGREFEDLRARGHARVTTVFGAYPVQRSRTANMSVGLALEAKTFQDRLEAVGAHDDKRALVAVATWHGDRRDSWRGGGINQYAFAWTSGRLNIRTPEAQQRDAHTANTHGQFHKLTTDVSRIQQVTPHLSLYASVKGQVVSRNVDSSEKMAMGGRSGVRAYPQSEASADEGWVFTLEARHQVPLSSDALGQVHLAAFVDTGVARIHKRPWQTIQPRRHLRGAGLGVYWTQSRQFSVQAFYARKLGGQHAQSAPSQSGRVWIQAVTYF